jgi:pectate lyase
MRNSKPTHISNTTILAITVLVVVGNSLCWAKEEVNSSKYLDAVRQFADNVLKYGRDTYGHKKTPLFVDGLNVHTHEPVKWIEPNGDKWILSNLSSQQTLFRTLEGLTTITGDPKYRQAAIEAIEYAFEHLRSPNGLFYWGGTAAYDVLGERNYERNHHTFKGFYPYYEFMWRVNPKATEQLIENMWACHILDWLNLDMNRYGPLNRLSVSKGWDHEYKAGPVFDGKGLSFFNTASDLIYAAVQLARLSGNKEPLVWARRLAKRYVDVRDPNTGISYGMYTLVKKQKVPDSYDAVLRKLVPGATDFPVSTFPGGMINPKVREVSAGYRMPTPGIRVHRYLLQWQSLLMIGEALGSYGKEFKQWALEELIAFGKCYRKRDNVYIPMLTDGTILEGYVVRVEGPLGPKDVALEPIPAGPSDLWAYTMCYRITSDAFMWEMARSISKGCGLGDTGDNSNDTPKLNHTTNCSDPYAILSFLELHRATGRNIFLEMAKRIGSNVLDNRLHKGFFVASKKHTYSKFDTMDSLALLHLHSALVGTSSRIPKAYPSTPFFERDYRKKEYAIDNQLFYTFTEFSEPPISIQEAAAVGDIDSVRSILEKGGEIDAVENPIYRTALHRSAKGGHKEVVQLLLTKGANIEATDSWPGATPLYYGVEQGHREIAELLIAHGADIDATIKYPAGDTPLHIAVRNGHMDIVDLLIIKGADVNTKNEKGETPIEIIGSRNRQEIIDLLKKHGATEKPPQSFRQKWESMSAEEKEKLREQLRKRYELNKK